MEIHEILKRPYQRILVPDDESRTFTAFIAEFAGCIAQGDTAAEALENLARTAESWLEGALDEGLPIPEPIEQREYSGRVVLRMPRNTHQRAVQAAHREGVSLNTFIASAVSERLGEWKAASRAKARSP